MEFQATKQWFSYLFNELLNTLDVINKYFNGIDHTNKILQSILSQSSNANFDEFYKNLSVNVQMILRNKMKCVLFGKTSNGKSAVINAMLNDKVLPSNKGRTTSCFISVQGCSTEEGYIIDKNNTKRELKYLDRFANELNEECYGINSKFTVFWPKQRCSLLTNDLEILDSPGVDYSKDNNEWINSYCEDADVFILVVDGNSTLNESEKSFFFQVRNSISKPNIFVLVNKWDMVENDPDANEDQIKKQHASEISRFIVNDLNLYDEHTVSDRIYFVSALETLKRNGTLSFAKFQDDLTNAMSENAIKTKYKPHIDKGREILLAILDMINKFRSQVHMRDAMSESDESKFKLSIEKAVNCYFNKMKMTSENLINTYIHCLSSSLEKAIDSQTNIDTNAISFFENDFPKHLSSVFSENLQQLMDVIPKKMAKRCVCNSSTEEIKLYLSNDNDFENISRRYEEDILLNLNETTSQIRNLFKNKEERIHLGIKIIKYLRTASSILTLPAILISRAAPPVGVVLGAAAVVTHIIPLPSSENIKNDMLKEFQDFYNKLTTFFIEKFQKEVEKQLKKATSQFIKHEKQVWKTRIKFEDLFVICSKMLDDLMEKDDSL